MSNLETYKQNDHILLKPSVLEEVKLEVFKTVNASIAKCFADLRYQVPSENDVDYLVNGVTKSILKNSPSLRTAEIPIAFTNGIRGKYGEYFGLSVVTFENFISGYLNSVERTNLVKEKSQLLIETPKEPTAAEKFQIGKKLCVDLFSRYQKTKQLDRTVSAVYEFLKPLNLIHPDYKKGIYKDAMDEAIRLRQVEITLCMEPHKRRQLNAELEMFNQNIANDMITQDQHSEVLRTGKRIIIKNWFNDLILNETDLNTLIEYKI